MKASLIPLALVTGLLAGCGSMGAATDAGEPSRQATALGDDRDAHGCRASAGYAWCARSNRCERPWELAAERGFENSAEAFERYCNSPD